MNNTFSQKQLIPIDPKITLSTTERVFRNTNNPSFGLTSDQSQIRELASRIVNLLLCAVGDPLSFIDIVPETT